MRRLALAGPLFVLTLIAAFAAPAAARVLRFEEMDEASIGRLGRARAVVHTAPVCSHRASYVTFVTTRVS